MAVAAPKVRKTKVLNTTEDLNDVIREVIHGEGIGIADPALLAEMVVKKLQPQQKRQALALALRMAVLRVISSTNENEWCRDYAREKSERNQKAYGRRSGTRKDFVDTTETPVDAMIKEIIDEYVASITIEQVLGEAGRNVYVNGAHKFFGACTSEELRMLEEMSISKGMSDLSSAALSRAARAAVDRAGVVTVNDLQVVAAA